MLIGAALSLLDSACCVRYYRVRKSALVLSLIASLGVIVLGVLQGIVIAIVLAMLLVLPPRLEAAWRGAGAGRRGSAAGTTWPLPRGPRGSRASSCCRWEAPLFFANSAAFRTRCGTRPGPAASWVVVQCEAVTDIDVSAAQMLEQLDRELNASGIHMAFVEMRARLQDLVFRYGLYETLDRDRFYPTLGAALAAIQAEDEPPTAETTGGDGP